MAIVKMKRLHMLALESDRNALFDRIQALGCLEVSEQSSALADKEWAALVHQDESVLAQQQARLSQVGTAVSLLEKYALAKEGLLSPRPQAKAAQLFDDAAQKETAQAVTAILEQAEQLDQITDQIQRLRASMNSLVPWLSLDVPLETHPSGALYTAFGTLPGTAELDLVQDELRQNAAESELYLVSRDTEAHYIFFMCHISRRDEALDLLKANGFTSITFKDVTGTAQENYDRQEQALDQLEQQQEALLAQLTSYGSIHLDIKLLYDRLILEVQKESCKQRLLATDQVFFLSGWVEEEKLSQLKALLDHYDCAYSLSDPTEDEIADVPVKLKNGIFSRCMNTVTEMYSLPAYDGIDPNPLMAPFFIFFFGMMMADMGYGLVMVLGCLLVLKLKRPRESQRNFFELFLWCGVSTLLFGALTGGFFGDFIPQLLKIKNPESTFALPALFTPLDDTVAILIGSLILGVIQILTGMVISVIKKIKDGNLQDAIWEEFTWWIILTGIALAVLGVGSVGGVPVVLVIGGLMLVYGSGRNARGFGKVTSLIGAVYNGVTGYFSDILSYLRLMALMLSGSVIAQVFNTLGSVFGNVYVFIIISMIGNALNLALNLLGCYVHDLRLQCLEFFNRFYKDGGKAYSPLSIQTKYIDIIKEEQ